jgi:hypothetical protein
LSFGRPDSTYVPVLLTRRIGDDEHAVDDVTFQRGGLIDGRVTSKVGLPVDDVTVRVLTTAGVEVATADVEGGWFSTDVIPAGRYVVLFDAPNGSPYEDQYFDKKKTFATAQQVKVGVGVDRHKVNAILDVSRPRV